MELLESRTIYDNTLLDIVDLEDIFENVGYRFDVLDNNVFSDHFLTRQVYPC